jgi:hypothetical protein
VIDFLWISQDAASVGLAEAVDSAGPIQTAQPVQSDRKMQQTIEGKQFVLMFSLTVSGPDSIVCSSDRCPLGGWDEVLTARL